MWSATTHISSVGRSKRAVIISTAPAGHGLPRAAGMSQLVVGWLLCMAIFLRVFPCSCSGWAERDGRFSCSGCVGGCVMVGATLSIAGRSVCERRIFLIGASVRSITVGYHTRQRLQCPRSLGMYRIPSISQICSTPRARRRAYTLCGTARSSTLLLLCDVCSLAGATVSSEGPSMKPGDRSVGRYRWVFAAFNCRFGRDPSRVGVAKRVRAM